MAVLEKVVFAYTKIQSPVKVYQSEDTEFTVDAVVSKAAAKKWNKEHPKNKAKEHDNEDFLEIFRFEEVPFDGQDEQYVIKFKKAHTKNGVELPEKYRPRVFEPDEDGKPVDITFEKLVGNGSKGKVSYSTFTNDFGTFVQLGAILVEDLVEYEGGGAVGSEFGATSLAEAPKNQKPVKKQGEVEKEEAPAKKTTKKPKEVPVEDEDDGDCPF